MSEGLLLAVVVVGRDEERNLPSCFESIRAMNFPHRMEVVYVDSASTDASVSIANRFGIRTIVLSDAPHSSTRGRDTGWRATSAPLVLFLDGDCVLHPDFARQAVEAFDAPDVGIVSGGVREDYHFFFQFMLSLRFVGRRTGRTRLMGGNYICRRSVLQAVGGFDTNLHSGANTDLGLRAALQGFATFLIDVPMLVHRPKFRNWHDCRRRSFRLGYFDFNLIHTRRISPLRFSEYDDIGPRFFDAARLAAAAVIGAGAAVAGFATALSVFAGLVILLSLWKSLRAGRKKLRLPLRLGFGFFIQWFSFFYLAGGLCWACDRLAGIRRTFSAENRSYRLPA